MEISSNPLMAAAQQILFFSPLPPTPNFTAALRVNNKPIPILKVLAIDLVRDYTNYYTDQVVLQCEMESGTFMYDVYPYKSNIKVVLNCTYTLPPSSPYKLENRSLSTEYIGILIDSGDASLEGANQATQTKEDMNILATKTVRFQLVDSVSEELRLKSLGTIGFKTSPGIALKTILTETSKHLQSTVDNAILGVDMVDPDNNELRDHISIPHGTRLVDLADFLQHRCGGIYNSGIGVYLQSGMWYVWPEYRLDRFKTTPKSLIVYNLPADKFPQTNITYRWDGQTVKIVATGEVQHTDDSEEQLVNQGSGVRFNDARSIMEGFATTANNNIATIQRATNTNEYKVEDRENQLNNVVQSPTKITENVYVEYSRLARRMGCFVTLVWENSNPSLIYPGMPVQLVYTKMNQVITVEGCVAATHHYYQAAAKGMIDLSHVCNSSLVLWVDRKLGLSKSDSVVSS